MVDQHAGASMSVQSDTHLVEKLGVLQLSADEAVAYLTLLEMGPLGVLAISRELGIPRTNAYRLVQRLTDVGLVASQAGSRGATIVPQPPEALEALVLAHQRSVDQQKELLPSLLGELANLSGKGPLGSRIYYYDGIDGLRQVTEHSLEAKNGLRIYEVDNLTGFVDMDTAEAFRREFTRRRIPQRQLTNFSSYDEFTSVPDYDKHWELRYVDPNELPIDFEILIYNDTVAFYTYQKDDVFCAEIRSAPLASMQRSIFDVVWKAAKRMRAAPGSTHYTVVKPSRPTRRL